jgi:hypothetical protein
MAEKLTSAQLAIMMKAERNFRKTKWLRKREYTGYNTGMVGQEEAWDEGFAAACKMLEVYMGITIISNKDTDNEKS